MSHYLTALGYIIATVTSISAPESIDTKPTPAAITTGWGGPNCISIDNKFGCTITGNGVIYTDTINKISYPVYNTEANCEAGTTVGLLKRPQ